MPRKARYLQLQKSLIYHVINRGIINQDIFHSQEDASYFLFIIQRYKKIVNFKIYHWCIMHNHYHLLIELNNPKKLTKLIGAIQQIYVRYYHKTYNTRGRLFQNRFVSQSIANYSYLLNCGRYIELNPCRAKIVKQAWLWPWSSAQYYVSGKNDNLTDPNPEWGSEPKYYKTWLLDSNNTKDIETFHPSISIVGDKNFAQKLEKINNRYYPKLIGRPKKKIEYPL